MNIIPAEYYQAIYLSIVAVCFFFVYPLYESRTESAIDRTPPISSNSAFYFVVLIILFIGLRPISSVFIDMTQYVDICNVDHPELYITWDHNNLIYDNLMFWLATIGFPPTLFYLFIAAIYFSGMFIVCKKFFPDHIFVTLLVFLSAFSTFSYGTNGIKAGAAASLFLISLAYRDRKYISVFFVILSLGVHHSMQVLVAAYILTLINNNPKYYMALWGVCLLLSIAHVTFFQTFFAGFTDEHGAEYLLSVDTDWNSGRQSGFRYDFVLYSVMPIIMGWHTIYKKGINNKIYNIVLCTYIFANCIWLLCMYASYSNRFAYLSWFLHPLVLIYPMFLPEWGAGRYKIFANVAAASLAFTLFMNLVYYNPFFH